MLKEPFCRLGVKQFGRPESSRPESWQHMSASCDAYTRACTRAYHGGSPETAGRIVRARHSRPEIAARFLLPTPPPRHGARAFSSWDHVSLRGFIVAVVVVEVADEAPSTGPVRCPISTGAATGSARAVAVHDLGGGPSAAPLSILQPVPADDCSLTVKSSMAAESAPHPLLSRMRCWPARLRPW